MQYLCEPTQATIMPPVLVRAASDSNDALSSMPAELITVIFCLLPSFSDVIALAATCHRLRHIWTTNTTTIFINVAPRGIPCHRYARNFLTDQGGPALDSPTLSAEDVVRMVRNSHIVEKAVFQFEKEIVPWIKSTFCARPEILSIILIDPKPMGFR